MLIETTEPSRIFISYARENLGQALRLFADLQKAGLHPWIDREHLLPGQRWAQVIPRVIRESKYVIVLMSQISLTKRGYVQKEMRVALDVLDEIPEDQIFVIPVRLDDCQPSHSRLKELHWVDLFPTYKPGLQRLLLSMGIGQGIEFRPTVQAPLQSATITVENYDSLGALALALKPKNSALKRRIQSRLALLSALSVDDRRMVENLQLETHLPTSTMRELLTAIANSSEEPSQIRTAIRNVCQANLLKGERVRASKSTTFISIQSLDTFCSRLVSSGIVPSVLTARDWLQRLSLGDFSYLTVVEQQIWLTKYIAWACPSPWDINQELTAKELARSLGTDLFARGDSMILLEYRLPDRIPAQFPTFCDVYASEWWSINFRPAPPGAPYGLTSPTDLGVSPLPEVVHRPIRMRHVVSVRLVR